MSATTSGPGASGPGASDTVAQFVGTALARLGAGHAFGVVGSGNFHVTNALRAAASPAWIVSPVE